MSNETTDGNSESTQPKTNDNVVYSERQLKSSFEHSLKISSNEKNSSTETTGPSSTETTVAPPDSTETAGPSSTETAVASPDSTETAGQSSTETAIAPPDSTETTVAPPDSTETAGQSSTETAVAAPNSTETTVAPPNSALRIDAPDFTPFTRSTATVALVQPTTKNSEVKFDMNSSSIYNVKKFRYEYTVSQLKSSFDPDASKFRSPSGLSALPDDRLLVADFNQDCIFLLDLNGVVQNIYPNIKSPKDVLYHSSRASQFIVASQKELIAIDIETGKRVITSKLRGFYPWNVQYIPSANINAACDPSGERIVYLDQSFGQVGETSLKNIFGEQANQKVYPYAVSFVGHQNAFVLSHYANQCRLNQIDVADSSIVHTFDLPTSIKSYSIYTDAEEKCLIADETNHRLISIGKTSNIEEYPLKTCQSPYAMTFLSDGTLCVTYRNAAQPSTSGFCVISEEDRRAKN